MPVAILIALKDLRLRLRDRTAIITGLIVPFAMAAILGLTIPNIANKSNSAIKIGVVNDDHGPAALYFIKEVLGPLQRQKVLQLHPAPALAAGRSLVSSGRATATFVVPSGFSKAGESETPTRLEIVGNGKTFKQTGTFIARSIALAFANQLNSVRLAVASTRKQHPTPGEVTHLGEHATNLQRPLAVHSSSLPSKELGLKTHEVAGLTVFFLFFTVQFGFLSIIDERTQGTLTRLLVASVPRRSIILGKLLTSVVLGLVSVTALALATTFLLGAHWGKLPGLAMLVCACVVAATAMTACIATFAQTSEQAGHWQIIIAVLMGALGGAMFPVAQAGGTLAFLSLLTPHAQFLRGLGLLDHGGGPAAVLPMCGAILVFAAILGGVALLRIRHLVEL